MISLFYDGTFNFIISATLKFSYLQKKQSFLLLKIYPLLKNVSILVLLKQHIFLCEITLVLNSWVIFSGAILSGKGVGNLTKNITRTRKTDRHTSTSLFLHKYIYTNNMRVKNPSYSK